jgi:hypothetical protein
MENLSIKEQLDMAIAENLSKPQINDPKNLDAIIKENGSKANSEGKI